MFNLAILQCTFAEPAHNVSLGCLLSQQDCKLGSVLSQLVVGFSVCATPRPELQLKTWWTFCMSFSNCFSEHGSPRGLRHIMMNELRLQGDVCHGCGRALRNQRPKGLSNYQHEFQAC